MKESSRVGIGNLEFVVQKHMQAQYKGGRRLSSPNLIYLCTIRIPPAASVTDSMNPTLASTLTLKLTEANHAQCLGNALEEGNQIRRLLMHNV